MEPIPEFQPVTRLPDSPCWVGASRPLSWRQRLSWLISALSGTVWLEQERVQIENEIRRDESEHAIEMARLDRAISRLDAFLGYSAASGATRRRTGGGSRR